MRLFLILALLGMVSGRAATGEPNAGFYRFPALHGDTLVFTSEGDLWRVPVSGGIAQRLTTHPGAETHAAISPDGTTLAFAAEYEGPTEVYTMPLHGGLPARLTFDGSRTTVAGWTPEGGVLVRTTAASTLPQEQLSIVEPVAGSRRPLPLDQASEGTYEPDSGTLFFTRFPAQGSTTHRYRGGWVQRLWRFGPGDAEATPLTADFLGTSKNPMWWKGRLYFLSDRNGVMNVWSCLPDGSDTRPHTHHQDFQIASASLHDGRIAYQHGADLRLLDLDQGTDVRIPIRLASDFDQRREHWIKKPLDYLTAVHPSPNGDRAVLTARGQVFVAPVGPGRLVEIPRPPDVRYRDARFLPDGRSLVALSDASGELEFWRLPADGLTPRHPLTTNGTVFRFGGTPSPDGQWLVWGDKDLRLWVHHLERRETVQVAESRMDPITDFAWSPDSQWLAYVDAATNTYRRIHLYRPSDGTRAVATSDRTDSYSPAWSPDGKWLYFLSDRTLRSLVGSPWGPRQPEPFFTEATKIYQLALVPGLRSPFAEPDELTSSNQAPTKSSSNPPTVKPAPAQAPASEEGAATATPTPTPVTTNASPKSVVTIDLAGLPTRLHEVPVPAGNYEDLSVTPKHLLWVSRAVGFDAQRRLNQLEIDPKDPKPKTLVDDLRSYELTVDRKKVLVRKGDDFFVIAADTGAPAKLEEKVRLGSWTFSIQPREEWRQIFTESWRMLRDFFYDRGMHQLDWAGTLHKYLPLIDRVSDRAELSAVISGMIGELSTLHHYVRYGDEREGDDRIGIATLGAQWVRDDPAGGWRITHVYRTDPDYPSDLAPLARPGVDVKPGDIIVSINGRSTLAVEHPSELLRHQADRQVLLEIRSPSDPQAQPRRVIVFPIPVGKDANLRYTEWEFTRRERVEKLGEGQIGYVHLRAMGTDNIAEWARDYYPVFQRQGLIIDVRHNRGGNIDSWILGRLLRRAWFYWQPRVGDPYWNMQYAFRGHLVVLCNEHTASDGEAFAEGFRRLGLGPVIGTRTWGGEIWLSAQRWLVDRGMATAAEYGVYGPEGAWLIEGHGVEPDLVVDNLPHATFQGEDAQLDAAIRHLQERIAADPRPVPPAPPYPNKAFRPSQTP